MKEILIAISEAQNLMERLLMPKEGILKKMKDKTVAKFTGKNTTQEKENRSSIAFGLSKCLRIKSGGFVMPAIHPALALSLSNRQ